MDNNESENVQKPFSPNEWLEYVQRKVLDYNQTRTGIELIIPVKIIMCLYRKDKIQEIGFRQLESGFTQVVLSKILNGKTKLVTN